MHGDHGDDQVASMGRRDQRLTKATTAFARHLVRLGLSYPAAARKVADTGTPCSSATIGIVARGEREPSIKIARAIELGLQFPARKLITL